jgi:hypothetical protein
VDGNSAEAGIDVFVSMALDQEPDKHFLEDAAVNQMGKVPQNESEYTR